MSSTQARSKLSEELQHYLFDQTFVSVTEIEWFIVCILTEELDLGALARLLKTDDKLYKYGFKEELMGNIKTTTQTYISMGIVANPVWDKIPIMITGIQHIKSVPTMTAILIAIFRSSSFGFLPTRLDDLRRDSKIAT